MTELSTKRLVGLETEYGVLGKENGKPAPRQQPELYSVKTAQAVRTWQATLHPDKRVIGWDWEGENPLRDLRGTELDRASAHPSLLTDNPREFAPDGGDAPAFTSASLVTSGSPMQTNVVLTNGGRFYVDHAHPEYSTPETATSEAAVLWDAAGEVIARRAMHFAAQEGTELVLYKNNTDGKGSAYGAHENYLLTRTLPYEILKDALVGFFVTRPVICGAGRIGLGQRSEKPGFQISARADFIGDLVGLQTTFNRPIVNTRDEAHAGRQWRRLHVINGDANRFQYSILYRVASTRAWLAALEAAWLTAETSPPLEGLRLNCDAVEACTLVSYDTDFTAKFPCADGRERNAWQWQWEAANVTAEYLAKANASVLPDGALEDAATWIGALRLLQEDPEVAATRVEWLGKREVFAALAGRLPGGWNNPKLAALDIAWADLREGYSPIDKLGSHRGTIFTTAALERAALDPPENTRAALRGKAVQEQQNLVAASWTTLVKEIDEGRISRDYLPDFV